AMVEVCGERGAGNVTVAHVVERSGVSRRTFYEQFDDREACFLAAIVRVIGRIAARVVPAFDGEVRWRDRVRAGLGELLVFFEEDPAIGRLCVVETLGAGDRALERRSSITGVLIDGIDRVRTETGRRSRGDPPAL